MLDISRNWVYELLICISPRAITSLDLSEFNVYRGNSDRWVLSRPPIVVRLSVCPSCPHYHSTDHNIYRILSIFITASSSSRDMNPFDYEVSILISKDPVALRNFMNTHTDVLLGLGRSRVLKIGTVLLNMACQSRVKLKDTNDQIFNQ